MPENDAFAIEAKIGMAVFDSEDAKEGPRAFAEKRAPRVQGRADRARQSHRWARSK